MARPTKQGLSYFPLECQLDNEFQIFKFKTGANGLAIWITILQMIYSNEGYFICDSDDLHVLIRREINVELEQIQACIELALEKGIFHPVLHETQGILTSRGIQVRYFDAAKRKKSVKAIREFLLIDVVDYQNVVIANINPNNAYKNATKEEVEVKENIEVEGEGDIEIERDKLPAISPHSKSHPKIVRSVVTCEDVRLLWNEFAGKIGLPICYKLTKEISSQITDRNAGDLIGLQEWRKFFEHIGRSEFLSGKQKPTNNKSNPFKATLGWVTREDKFAKIANGDYD